ncbi:uncharacterized protein LOC129590578 [Paramacrobiotus metropolitanus]|uniref:uncharacterized protein LOC129590578 n=1 Tax=Paramacrobiotus metropolitanus TaxID=2943436 RepID=UPI0024464E09|nr:uncharacterized protein LOC129590578 [Paramacrobiotus metropolitanus]
MAQIDEPAEIGVTTAFLHNPLTGDPFDKGFPEAAVEEDEKPLLEPDKVDPTKLPTFYAAVRLVPFAFFLCMGAGIYSPVWTELLKNRVCLIGLHIPANVCAHITDDQYKEQGDAVRSMTADYQQYDTLIGSLPAIFFNIFVGAWSDRFGRKLPMVVPMIGMTLAVAFTAVVAYFPMHPAYLLIASILSTLTGGWTIILMAKFSYIGDHTTSHTRAMNIAIIDGSLSLFMNSGGLLGGVIYTHLGRVTPFYIATGMYVACILYVLLVIRDQPIHTRGERPGLLSLFTLRNLQDNYRMLRKPRMGDTRLHLWLVLLALAIYSICESGDSRVMQLYVEFPPFHWSLYQYTVFSCVAGFASSSCVIVSMYLLRTYLHVSDTLVAFMACFSGLLSYFTYGIAWASWMLYLAVGVGLLRLLLYVSIRSLMSGLVDSDEIGKSMSLISSMQSITPVLGALIFTNMFARTSHWWAGLCYVMAAFALVPVWSMLGYVDVMRRRAVYREDYKYQSIKPDASNMEPATEDGLVAALVYNPVPGGPFEKHPKDIDDDEQPLLNEVREGKWDPSKLSTFYASYRMVPMALIMCMGWGISTPVWIELLKNRVCSVALQFPANVCALITEDEFKTQGDAVRSMTADYQQYDTLISSLPAIIFNIFVGAWSDKVGRKLPMILPLIGATLSAGYTAAVAAFPHLHPGYLLIGSIVTTITGGWTIVIMAMFSYIGDHTTDHSRSMNIALLDGSYSLFTNSAILIGGVLFKYYGVTLPLYICAGVYLATIVYVWAVIRDVKINSTSSGQTLGICSLFSVQNLKDNFQMMRRKRLGGTRLHIWLVFLSLAIYGICDSGDSRVNQLFMEFAPFYWSLYEYSIFSCVSGFVSSVSVMVLMLVLRKYLQVSDTLVSFIACLSAILGYFTYGIAVTTWMLYLGAGLGLLRLLLYVSVRSMMSGLVDSDEIGKSMSLISSMQSIIPVVGALIFTNMFARTSSWWSGLCYVLAAFVLVPVLAMFGYVDVVRRRDLYRNEKQ